jgi:hypothetical protein
MNFTQKLYKTFCITVSEQNIMNFFYKDNSKSKNSKKILIQTTENIFYYGLFATIANSVREKKSDLSIDFFVNRSLTWGASSHFSYFIKSIFLYNSFRDRKWIKIYYSFCDHLAYTHTSFLGLTTEFRLFRDAIKIYNTTKNKDDVVNIEVNNIKIGDLIYDTYMRYKPSATVNVNDKYLLIVIYQALKNFYKANHYFQNNDVKFVLVSYSSYIEHGIVARVAVDSDVPVYSFGSSENFSKTLNRFDTYHTTSTNGYRTIFNQLDNQKNRLLLAKKSLHNKFSGIIEDAYSYMKKVTPYKEVEVDLPKLKGAIVVFLHDFFDSPHIYHNMIFPDFVEWLDFTVKTLESNNALYYIKPHPAATDEVENILNVFRQKYTNFNVLSKKITNKQLVENGIILGLTVYGTVAHELAYMNVPVVTCGNGPHTGFEFCYEATDKKEYEDFLSNYKNLHYVDHEVTKQNVEVFYYMYYLYNTPSEQELLKVLNAYRVMSYNDENIKKLINIIPFIRENIHFQEFIEKILD